MGFLKRKKKEKSHELKISIVDKDNIKKFLEGIDKSVSPLAGQKPDSIREPLLKESQLWFDNTVNVGHTLDGNSFRAGAVYGIYAYIRALTEKSKENVKKDSYVV